MTTATQPELWGKRPPKCHPHDWIEPSPVDQALVCRRCGRTLAFDQIDGLRRHSILASIARRQGSEVAVRVARFIRLD